MSGNKNYPVSSFSLRTIYGEKYRPTIPKKHFSENGVDYINTHEPTELMMEKGKPNNEPKVILDLLFNFCNYNIDYMEYFINWIAYNFNYGKKPIVSVGIFGLEGSGKGIFNYIMKKLYGKENCSQFNAASFKSNYNIVPSIINKRFININELTYDISKRHESLIKSLITEDTIILGKEIELHAAILFTANYSTVFKLSKTDRRFTIFESGPTLESTNFLGLGRYETLEAQIDTELKDFAKYLKSYNVNPQLANKPLNTPEKEAIVNLSKTFIQDFHDAIVNLDITFFEILKVNHKDFYDDLYAECVFHKRFNKAHLTEAVFYLYGEDISTVNLMNQLRKINNKRIFEPRNTEFQGHSGNIHYIYPMGRM